jgi:hypothetical protein
MVNMQLNVRFKELRSLKVQRLRKLLAEFVGPYFFGKTQEEREDFVTDSVRLEVCLAVYFKHKMQYPRQPANPEDMERVWNSIPAAHHAWITNKFQERLAALSHSIALPDPAAA